MEAARRNFGESSEAGPSRHIAGMLRSFHPTREIGRLMVQLKEATTWANGKTSRPLLFFVNHQEIVSCSSHADMCDNLLIV